MKPFTEHIFLRKTCCLIFCLFAFVICLLTLRNHLCGIFNLLLPPKSYEHLDLSEDDRVFDFFSVYDTLVSSMSTLDDFAQRYGVDFRAKKSYYESMVRASENDYTFFLTMCAILQDIPSFHTDVITPGALRSLRCYGVTQLLADRVLLAKTGYWEGLDAESTQSQTFDFFALKYIDGVYIIDQQNSTIQNPKLSQDLYVVTQINGLSVDEYLRQGISLYNYHYDVSHDKPYKSYIVFNLREGEPVSIELTNAEGDSIVQIVYYSLRAENAFSQLTIRTEEAEMQVYEDDSVSYVRVPDMLDAHGNEVMSLLNGLKNNKVLLDLRGNYGGNIDFAETYIYPSLFSGNITSSSVWWFPISKANDVIYKNFFNRILLHLRRDSDSGLYYGTVKHSYRSQRLENKCVFILVDSRTGSAADRFVCDIKNHEKAVVLGENTGGEGLMRSYIAVKMPRSGLVYIFMPSDAKNPCGDSNSVCGTAPDYYVQQSVEDLWCFFNSDTEETDSSVYPKSFQYDTVLNYAISLLKSDEI